MDSVRQSMPKYAPVGERRMPHQLAYALASLRRKEEKLKTAVESKDDKKDQKMDSKAKPPVRPAPEVQALTDLGQALLSANEFLYVD